MAQTENTAVNRLIELAGSKPLELDGDDDLFGDPASRAQKKAAEKAAADRAEAERLAAQRVAIARVQAARVAANPAAKAPPVPFRRTGPTAAAVPQGTPAPELARSSKQLAAVPPPQRDDLVITHEPVVAKPALVPPKPFVVPPKPIALPPKPLVDDSEHNWFDPSSSFESASDSLDHTQGVRRSGWSALLWVAAAFALGLGVAALLFWPGKRAAKPRAGVASPVAPQVVAKDSPAAPAAASAAAPAAGAAPAAAAGAAPAADTAAAAGAAPAAAADPVAAAGAAPAAAAAPVSIHFDSDPPGATVVLVQNGETTPLGVTPLDHELDPSKHYEAMFSLENHASVILPVDATTTRVAATLAASGGAAPAPVAEAPKPATDDDLSTRRAPRHDSEKKSEKRVEKKADRKKVAKTDDPPKGGEGVLMLAAKPPCEILIDGKRTGLTTPQRDLSLAPGNHSVTLINRDNSIKESFSVTIKSSQATRVVKDLTSQMK